MCSPDGYSFNVVELKKKVKGIFKATKLSDHFNFMYSIVPCDTKPLHLLLFDMHR